MNLTSILKKLAAGEEITAAEKELLLANKDVLSAEQLSAVEKAKVTAVSASPSEGEDSDELDEKAMERLISKKLAERMDSITDQLAAKFLDGVTEQRKRVLETKENQNKSGGDDKTRTFLKALFNNDHAVLKDLTGSDSASGGYLIPQELLSEVLRIPLVNYGLARREMRYLPFTGPGNSRSIPALGSSVSVAWTDEGAAKRSTAPTFNIVTQTLKKLAAIVPMTEEILEDSTIDLNALVAQLFAEAVAKEEDIQFFTGTGSPWTGILNNGSVNVTNTLTTNPADITPDDLLRMIDAMPSGALPGSKFYMHRSVFSRVRGFRANFGGGAGTGAYLVSPPLGSEPASIWGYPIVLAESFPTSTGSANNKALVLFGNLNTAAIFGDKQSLRVKLLDQATVANSSNNGFLNLAQQDMVAIRIVERVGYVLALPKALVILKTLGVSSPSSSVSSSVSPSHSVSSSASSSPSPSA